jgi:hypothetical protein
MGIGSLNEGCFVVEDIKRKWVKIKYKEGREKGKGKETLKGQLLVGPNLGQVRESTS